MCIAALYNVVVVACVYDGLSLVSKRVFEKRNQSYIFIFKFYPFEDLLNCSQNNRE